MQMAIGNIGNYNGGVVIKSEEGKYFWGIEDLHETVFKEISGELFYAMIRHQKKLDGIKNYMVIKKHQTINHTKSTHVQARSPEEAEDFAEGSFGDDELNYKLHSVIEI